MYTLQEASVRDNLNASGGLPAIAEAVELLFKYLDGDYYESKNKRLDEWIPVVTFDLLEEIVISVFTMTLTNHKLTYQALVGQLYNKINVSDMLDQVKIMSEIVAIISWTELILIRKGDPMIVTSGYDYHEEIPIEDSHDLQMHLPEKVRHNYSRDYGTLILGDRLNIHNDELCLSHINRMNSIAVSLNEKFLATYPETTDKEWETVEQDEQWEQFIKNSKVKYEEFIRRGNKGYFGHAYCTRGRCYIRGYYINLQGASYKKAMVQLHKKEIVTL